jgi:hypothetical protein
MDRRHPVVSSVLLVLALPITAMAQTQEPTQAQYPVPAVDPPQLVRPPIEPNRQLLPRGTTGRLPRFDGEAFRLRFPSDAVQRDDTTRVRERVDLVLRAVGWVRDPREIQLVRVTEGDGMDRGRAQEEATRAERETLDRLARRHGGVTDAARAAVREDTESLVREAARGERVYVFAQTLEGVPFEATGLRAVWREEAGLTAMSGNAYEQVRLTNRPVLDAARARAAAEAHVSGYTSISDRRRAEPERVILPYADAFRHAWRLTVEAGEGPYRVWVDAESGEILQLQPDFFPQAQGRVFDPDPNTGNRALSFSIDNPTGGNWRLTRTGVLTVNNNGADGQCTGALTLADDGSGTANFDAAPINGLVVTRTNQANYNCRFQDVNVYAWVSDMIATYQGLGSQSFPAITATVNHNNPCNFGINNACASGSNTLVFGIGQATVGTSTACGNIFNSAIDATVIGHEFGHLLNRVQFNASGGTLTPHLNEGLADYWADNYFRTDTFGAWWGGNCANDSQDGWLPRRAEASDFFPTQVLGAGSPHGRGQVIAWGMWSSRTGVDRLHAWGPPVLNIHLIQALATAGVGVQNGTQNQRVHDSFLDVFEAVATRYDGNRYGHKVLSGFARAGLFLSPAEAVVDIGDDFLDRNAATGPTLTAWAGRAYSFNTNESVNTTTTGCNTRVTIDVANDAGFTQNLTSSGTLTTATGSGSCNATWTVPAAAWTTLRNGDHLYYRARSTNAAGGNERLSGAPGGPPGNPAMSVPPARALINEGGVRPPCACGAAGGGGGAALFLIPFLVGTWARRRARAAR